MALTQMQIIQSLGEAMSWFERELQWGVPPEELRHLSGRIGELYAALITNGQMAVEVNQKGYDVVSGAGERVSVKTTTVMRSSGIVMFNVQTLNLVDRIIILRINTDEMQVEILLDEPTEKAVTLMTAPNKQGKASISLSKLISTPKDLSKIPIIKSVHFEQYKIMELENGTIEVEKNGASASPVKPVLREIASELGVNIFNDNGNPYNTRQLGTILIKVIEG